MLLFFVDVSACVSPFLPVSRVCFCCGGSSSVCDCFPLSRLLHCAFFLYSTQEAAIEESCEEDEEGDEDEGDALTSKRVRTG